MGFVPLLQLPCHGGSSPEKTGELLAFADRTSVLGSVMLGLTRTADGKSGLSDNQSLVNLVLDETGNGVNNPVHVCGLDLDDDDVLTALLDRGLHVGFFNYSVADDHEMRKKVFSSLPKGRIGISYTTADVSVEKMVEILKENMETCDHYLFRFECFETAEEDAFIETAQEIMKTNHSMHIYFVSFPGMSEIQIERVGNHENVHSVFFAKIGGTDSVPSLLRNPYTENEMRDSEVDYVDLFAVHLRTDRSDRLYTTVVCDEHDVCLGLVYSNEDSLRAAVVEKRGIYWSRSRGGLWRKGDTSGMHQDLLSIRYDCDADAMRFNVIQRGSPASFCHLMTRTCWGGSRGLAKLEEMLYARKESAPEGSYTAKLFKEPGLLQKKLLEEVQELVEAKDPDHIAAEAADVIYFMMTRCVAGGVTIRDIETHLDKRSLKVTRRPGAAKEWRTANAKALLGGAAPVPEPLSTPAPVPALAQDRPRAAVPVMEAAESREERLQDGSKPMSVSELRKMYNK